MPDREKQELEILRAALERTKDCPLSEELACLLDGQAESQVAEHVESCAWCQTEIKLLQSFEAADVSYREAEDVRRVNELLQARSGEIFRVPRTAPAPRPSWWQSLFARPWRSPAVLAMAAVLVLVAVGLEWRRNAPPTLGPVGGSDVLRSGALKVVAPTGDLQQAPQEIQWEAVPGATRYEVRLLEVDRTEMWKTETSELRVALPKAMEARIVPGKTILCQVAAYDSGGRKLSESEPVPFRIVPPGSAR